MNNQIDLISSRRLCKWTKQAAKTVVCLALCLCLIVGYSIKKPVKVEAAAVVGGIALGVFGVTALAALGVSVSAALGNTDAESFGKAVMEKAGLGDFSPSVEKGADGSYWITAPKTVMQSIANTFLTMYNATFSSSIIDKHFPQGHSFTGTYLAEDLSKLFGRNINVVESYVAHPTLTNVSVVYLREIYPLPQTIKMTNEFGYNFSMTALQFGSAIRYSIKNTNGRGDTLFAFNIDYVGLSPAPMCIVTALDGGILHYYPMYQTVNGDYQIDKNASNYGPNTYGFFDSANSMSIDKDKVYAQGHSILNNDAATVIGKAYDQYRAQHADKADDGNMELKLTGNPTKVDSKVQGQTQAQVLDGSIADTADKVANDTTNAGKDTSVPIPNMPDLSLPQLIIRKFPFSIPFDLYNSVTNMVAPAAPPSYTLPFIVVPALGWNYSITLDLAKFDKLAQISRWGFSLIFLIGLILITRKIIGA